MGVARLVIDPLFGSAVALWCQILGSLPNDAEIVGTSAYPFSAAVEFDIKSISFVDTPSGRTPPRINVTYKALPGGGIGLDTIDMSAALKTAPTSTQNTTPATPAAVTASSALSALARANHSLYDKYNKQVYGQWDTAYESKAPCNHTWAMYQGLVQTFEYCTKCNEKKK